MKKMMLALWLVAMVVAAGCDDVISARVLIKRTSGDKVNTIMWYYIGSENGCDCFCHEMMGLSASLPCPSVSHKTYYAVRSSEFPTFTRRFPRTDDHTKWLPVMFKEDWSGVEILIDHKTATEVGDPANPVNPVYETTIERNAP